KAKERLHYLKVYLETKLSQDLDERIASKNRELKGAAGKSPAERVADEFGIVLAEGEKYVYIEKMAGGGLSDAEKVLEPGDKIVSVWGEMMAFMRVDEVAQVFSAPEEVRVTIERVLVSKVRSANGLFGRLSLNKYSNMIGADLALFEEGVVVEKVVPGGAFDEAGVREGDILSRIDGKNTLYMPMPGIIRVIENKQERDMEIVVRRDITLWRKE
ncbi:MAG: PDZ domain-containing protein, partial [Candidatus Omnitrophota bacterium]